MLEFYSVHPVINTLLLIALVFAVIRNFNRGQTNDQEIEALKAHVESLASLLSAHERELGRISGRVYDRRAGPGSGVTTRDDLKK